MLRGWACGLLLIGIAAPGRAQAAPAGAEVHVSPSGSDEADGAASRPFRTVARAVQAAGPGVVVHLHAGTYAEAVSIAKGGAAGRPFVLQGDLAQRAVLDGNFAHAVGVAVKAPFVVIRGLEIRNYRTEGIFIEGPAAHHVCIERNVIHHITSHLTGEGDASRGIRAKAVSDCTIRQNTIYFVVGNNECFGILFDCRSSLKTPIRNLLIEKNLLYFLDKSGVRLVDNSVLDEGRYYVLADPVHIRENISIHNAYVALEVNYVNSNLRQTGGPLGDRKGAPVYTQNNFVGWCGSYGLNPKQSSGGATIHNTVYRTLSIGYLQSGGISADMRIEGNLFAENPIGSFIHTEGNNCRFVGNYYRQAAPWLDFFADRTKGWGTMYARMDDLRSQSNQRPEPQGVLNNKADVFVAPQKGDFRLREGCPAVGAAPDGADFGALEANLSAVGASGRYGLARIPMLPEIASLRVVGCSGEDPNAGPFDRDEYYPTRSPSIDNRKISTGLAAHLVDGSLHTVWRPAGGAASGWVAFDLPGTEPVPLGAFMVLGHRVGHAVGTFKANQCHPREMRLYVRSSEKEEWREVGRFVRYIREEGRVFPIGFGSRDGTPKARQVKLEVISNHGAPLLEVSEFRLYRAFEPFE